MTGGPLTPNDETRVLARSLAQSRESHRAAHV
jgi:hypothetical protein